MSEASMHTDHDDPLARVLGAPMPADPRQQIMGRFCPDNSVELRIPVTHPRYSEVLEFVLPLIQEQARQRASQPEDFHP